MKVEGKNSIKDNYPELKDKYRVFSIICRSLLQCLHMYIYTGIRTKTLGKDPGDGGRAERERN